MNRWERSLNPVIFPLLSSFSTVWLLLPSGFPPPIPRCLVLLTGVIASSSSSHTSQTRDPYHSAHHIAACVTSNLSAISSNNHCCYIHFTFATQLQLPSPPTPTPFSRLFLGVSTLRVFWHYHCSNYFFTRRK